MSAFMSFEAEKTYSKESSNYSPEPKTLNCLTET